MKSTKWSVLFVFATLAFGLTTGCPDDDTCTDCSCDPTLCDGGDADADNGADADADADSDADGDVPTTTLHVETWTLSSDGTPRDLPGADAEVDGQHCTTPCNLEVQTGTRHLSLTLSGWVQGPNPLEMSVATDSVTVNGIPTSIVEVSGLTLRHRLDHDLRGTWQAESGGSPDTWVQDPHFDFQCPDSWVQVGPVQPQGALCVEGETVSLCKTHAAGCSDYVENGQISADGQRVEFTVKRDGDPDYHVIYHKM